MPNRPVDRAQTRRAKGHRLDQARSLPEIDPVTNPELGRARSWMCQIALDSDIDRAREAMKRVADEIWREESAIIEEPEVWGVQSLGPAGITIRLVAKTRPLEQWRVSRLLRERIKAELDREGIEVPPPTPWPPESQPSVVSAGGVAG